MNDKEFLTEVLLAQLKQKFKERLLVNAHYLGAETDKYVLTDKDIDEAMEHIINTGLRAFQKAREKEQTK